MHHAACETRGVFLENDTAGFESIHSTEDSASVRCQNAGAQPERFHRGKVVHQNFSLFRKKQNAVSKIVEDRMDIMGGIDENEVELALFLHQCWKHRSCRAGAHRHESFQVGKTPTPDLFNRTELATKFPVQEDRPMLTGLGRDNVHRHQLCRILKTSNLIRDAENAQAPASAEFQNSLRTLTADDFPQKKSPLKIGRVIVTSFFPQPGDPTDLEHTAFLGIVLEFTQPSGECRRRSSHKEGGLVDPIVSKCKPLTMPGLRVEEQDSTAALASRVAHR